jgi:hypothetical protein
MQVMNGKMLSILPFFYAWRFRSGDVTDVPGHSGFMESVKDKGGRAGAKR